MTLVTKIEGMNKIHLIKLGGHMWDYYNALDSLIREEIENGQEIVICSLGRVGLKAKHILNERYGYNGKIIDDDLARYNHEIINLEQYKKVDSSSVTIILCIPNPELNRRKMEQLKRFEIKARIRNILDVVVIQSPEKKNYFAQIKQLCKVKEAIGYELVRVGQHWDGGYIMLNDFVDSNIAYSFGIGDDVSWDEWIASQNIDVFCYDYTIGYLPKENSRLHFKRIGISDSDCVSNDFLTLETIININKHAMESQMILKMDVEGAEWDIFETVSSEVLSKFSQMTFEFHYITDVENSEKVLAALEKINRTHQAIWIHANNSGGAEQAEEIVMPNLLEITYVNKEKYSFRPIEYKCPLDIDMPNIAHFPDLELTGWGYIMNRV